MAIHKVLVLNGMTSVTDADLSGLAISFMNSTGGLVGANDYLVTAQGTPNMTVNVSAGRAWLPNITNPPTNMYGTYLDSTFSNFQIANNPLGQPRIDYVVLYLNLAATGGTGANVPLFADILGTTAASPQPPTPTQITNIVGANNPYLILAQIGTATGSPQWIPPGVGSINSTMISTAPFRNFAFFTTGQTISVPQYEEFTDQVSAPSSPASGKTRLFTIGSNLFLKQPTGPIIQIGNTSINNGTSGATPSVDWTQGITQAYTLNANNIVWTFSNPVGGGKYILLLTQDSTGSRNVAANGWPNIRWGNGVAPTLTTTPGKIDIVGLIWDSIVNQYIGFYQTGF